MTQELAKGKKNKQKNSHVPDFLIQIVTVDLIPDVFLLGPGAERPHRVLVAGWGDL